MSFTDMITLLLAFFVMLQALAKEQNPELFYQGQGSFRRAIAGLGLPQWLFGKEQRLQAEDDQRRYPTEQQDTLTRGRVLDAEDERIRELFKDLRQQTETRTESELPRASNIITPPIRFALGRADLSAESRAYLAALCVDLRQSARRGESSRVYVVGAAPDVAAGRQQWMLSLRRAQAVAEVLREAVRGAGDWRVTAWGAAAAIAADRDETRAAMEHVRIAILGTE